MKGYKVFESDWTCRGKQYKCPGEFEEDVILAVCNKGMHFCKKAVDCFNYYSFDPRCKVAEVEAYGNILEDGNKCCTDKLKIVREVTWQEVLTLVNFGVGNTGFGNTGGRNTGDRNTGDYNTGNCNTGDYNTGDCNTGDYNTGDYNTCDYNTGHCNTGYYNTGYYNTGNRNTGYYNTGNRNTGDCNLSDGNSGCFNVEDHTITLFDKPSRLTLKQWRESMACRLLYRVDPIRWISSEEMTDAEKAERPEHETTGGYSKDIGLDQAYEEWWKLLKKSDRAAIKAIPNFDAEKFYEITGIKVEE